ncbi:MAG: acylphosphatase [Proteobacteria bacterium]|nr:acylphosphatase [Pseudomonadota bacterium]MBU1716862.1 acylphosphatase [Pseudomonadota bacterium]
MAVKRIRAVVFGLVQGVYFRTFAEAEGTKLKLAGWVRNLPDESVEVVMEGEEAKVDEMIQWLRHGPPTAKVKRVDLRAERVLGQTGKFNIRYN